MIQGGCRHVWRDMHASGQPARAHGVSPTHLAPRRIGALPWLAPEPARREVRVVMRPAEPSSRAAVEYDFSELIVAVAARQDRAAFSALFDHFAPRVKSYLTRSGATAESAEELAQETLLAVWRKASFFDPARGSASTWIFTIARNLRSDALRRERHPEALARELDEPAPPRPADVVLAAAEREARVREAMKSLSPEQAAVVRLSFYDEKAHAAIASELDLPLGTVKSRLRLAMNRMRSLLGEL
jgi:RNA polymerase sigma-70 factor (ECF subfamily)